MNALASALALLVVGIMSCNRAANGMHGQIATTTVQQSSFSSQVAPAAPAGPADYIVEPSPSQSQRQVV